MDVKQWASAKVASSITSPAAAIRGAAKKPGKKAIAAADTQSRMAEGASRGANATRYGDQRAQAHQGALDHQVKAAMMQKGVGNTARAQQHETAAKEHVKSIESVGHSDQRERARATFDKLSGGSGMSSKDAADSKLNQASNQARVMSEKAEGRAATPADHAAAASAHEHAASVAKEHASQYPDGRGAGLAATHEAMAKEHAAKAGGGADERHRDEHGRFA